MIGIEKIGFYTPEYKLDMSVLAKGRNIPVEKLTIGLGQHIMSVPPIYEDAVTLAANAVNSILTDEDRQAIDMILVGSESGVDHSKSIAVYVKELCHIQEHVRAVELKQACYGATMALQLAKSHLVDYPNKKVLVVATDIAKYGLNTPGETTQGAGAVAILISSNPKIARIERESTYLTRDIMDFWRPVYSDTAFAQGKFSTEQYILFFEDVFSRYLKATNRIFDDLAAICFHQPYTKLGLKALTHILDIYNADEDTKNRLLNYYDASRLYSQQVGNIYTGSLYLSLISLLENAETLHENDRIGLFSYGSGAVGEFFTVQLLPHYKEFLRKANHENMLNERQALNLEEYESMFSEMLPKDGSEVVLSVPNNKVVLYKVSDHIRYYQN